MNISHEHARPSCGHTARVSMVICCEDLEFLGVVFNIRDTMEMSFFIWS